MALTKDFELIKLLIEQGKLKVALTTVNKLEELSPKAENEAELLLMKSKILIKLGKFEEGQVLIDKLLNRWQDESNHYFLSSALLHKALVLWKLGRLEECLEFVDRCEFIIKTQKDLRSKFYTSTIAALIEIKAKVNYFRGNLEEALTDFFVSLKGFKTAGTKIEVASVLNAIGSTYYRQGKLDRAYEFYQKSLTLRKEVKNSQEIARSYNNLGNVSFSKGNLKIASEQHHKCLKLFQSIGNQQDIARSFNNLGEVYRVQGDLDVALDFYQKSLTLFEAIGNTVEIARSLSNIGLVYSSKNDYDRALDYHLRSLQLKEDIGNPNETSDSLYSLISIAVGKGTIDRARYFLKKMEKLEKSNKNQIISQRYRIAEALILKLSTRTRNRALAETLLEEVANEAIVDHELTVAALLNLCEILLVDLIASGNEEVLEEIQGLIIKLQEISRQQHSFWLLAETYLLKSQLALLVLDFKKAIQLSSAALLFAEEKGLTRLAMKISLEQDNMLNKIVELQELSQKSNLSFVKRTELINISKLLMQMINKDSVELSKITQEKSEMLLIFVKSGVCVYSEKFQSTSSIHEQILSGFLTAINSFLSETFSLKGSIELIKYKEYTILLKSREESLTFCYIFKGPSYFANHKVEQFIEALRKIPEVWAQLMNECQLGQHLNKKITKVTTTSERIFH